MKTSEHSLRLLSLLTECALREQAMEVFGKRARRRAAALPPAKNVAELAAAALSVVLRSSARNSARF